MSRNHAEAVLKTLANTFTVPKRTASSRNPFKALIITVISQNTADRNTTRAFESLSNKFRILPETLANAKLSEIETCLKVAGLYRNKAKMIHLASKIILEKYQGDLGRILSLPLEQAREQLLQLPGVGPKTADVVLLFSANKPTVPVDTHVHRVSKRLGLAPQNGDYEAVRSALQTLFNPKDYMAVHLLLIHHGRRYCRARGPLCDECPLAALCPSAGLFRKAS